MASLSPLPSPSLLGRLLSVSLVSFNDGNRREVVSWNLREVTSQSLLSSLSPVSCSGCDVVITSIGSDHALEEIFVELFAGQQSKKALPDSA